MTAFRPGDLAQVVPGGGLHGAELEPGDLVLVVNPDYDDYNSVLVTGALGESTRPFGPAGGWHIDADALRLFPADEQGHTSPAPSPLTRLIRAAAGIAVAFLDGRVSIEQRWHDPDRTTYRIVIEEKA